MKDFKLLICFLILLSKSSAIDSKIFFETQNNVENSASNLLKVLHDTIRPEQVKYDILIAKLDNYTRDSITDDIAMYLGNDNPLVISDLSQPLVQDGLKKAKLMIIEVSELDWNVITTLAQRHFTSSVWNYIANIIFISHSAIPQQYIAKILFKLSQYGYLNVAIMHKVNGKFEVKYSDIIMENADNEAIKTLLNDNGNIFPDKIKNLRGFTLHVPVYNQPPIVMTEHKNLANKFTKFVEILEEKMNAIAKYHIVENKLDILNHLKRRELHITLNNMGITSNAPTILTYEVNGFCALIPKPLRTSVTELIFIKPFDGLVWVFFGCTILACLVIWRLFLNRGTSDSFWLLLFGMFAMFVGQSVEFRRTHRVVLVILLQLIVLMIFVLSNGYQGVITAFMIQPEIENRIATVKELIESRQNMLVSAHFKDITSDSEEFQSIKSNMDIVFLETISEKERNKILLNSFNKKNTIIMQCFLVENFWHKYSNAKLNYYMLPQKIITTYEYLAVGNQNPFIRKFQHLMDLSFEAGLPQAWTLFLGQNINADSQQNHGLTNLKLKDLSQIFYFLMFGHLCAILVFMVEIFLYDFINKFNLSVYTLRLRKYINEVGAKKIVQPACLRRKKNVSKATMKTKTKAKKPKIMKPKVRKISVKPANSPV